jgi:uncharacterized membrane protein YadS
MIRVMMLAPFLLILSAWLGRRHQSGSKEARHHHSVVCAGFSRHGRFQLAALAAANLGAQLIALDNLLLAMGALGLLPIYAHRPRYR